MATINKGLTCFLFLIVVLSPIAHAKRLLKETNITSQKENGTSNDAIVHQKRDKDCHGEVPGVYIPGVGVTIPVPEVGVNVPGGGFNVPEVGVNIPSIGVNFPGVTVPGVNIPGWEIPGTSIGIPGVSVGAPGHQEGGCGPPCESRCGGCDVGRHGQAQAEAADKEQDVKVAN